MSVRLLLINQFGVDLGFYVLIPYLATHLDRDLGMSAAAIGLILGVRNLCSQCLFVLGGSATDRLGAHVVIPAGCLLRTVGFGLFACGGSLHLVLAASALTGLSAALFYPSVRAYLTVESQGRAAEAFGLLNIVSTAGALAGLALGSVLFLVDFRMCAMAATAMFAVLTIAQLFALPPQHVLTTRSGVLDELREAIGNRGFLAFAAALVGMATMETQMFLLMPQGARLATGWDAAGAFPPALGTIVSLALQLRITRYVRAHGDSGRWVAPGLALMGLGFLPPALVSGLHHPPDLPTIALRLLPVCAGVCVLYLGVMVAQPAVMELIPKFGREELTGTYFGLFYLFSGFASAAANLIVGWTMDLGRHTGRTWLPWACCTALGLLSAAGAAWLHHLRALPLEPGTALAA
ncbi:MFS family permease [Kitasatospora kifunensis]|uniref:MFS family permease n=2 Tax=Kitasatospora kifunensis TaxID=58351 RepID=A0A7W7VWV9_KITKI|nr:MFS transporter [Kitasatospora kifunensis]MBB4925917.1 MFS family permease [Kitasatospora kifunensis]